MLTNIIYIAVFIIIVFVLSIAVKEITRGVEAKQIIKEDKKIHITKEEAAEYLINSLNNIDHNDSGNIIDWRGEAVPY